MPKTSVQIPPHRSSSPTHQADMCGRVTRSAVHTRKTANQCATVPTVDQCDCVMCGNPVSPDMPSVQCTFCGLHVHAQCDSTLTVKSVKMVNDERHPSICYKCTACRPTQIANNCGIRHSNTGGNGPIEMEQRMTQLEEQIRQIRELVQPVANERVQIRADAKSPTLPKLTPKPNTPVLTARPKPDELRDKRTFSTGLSVICTNVMEANDTLLHNKQKHDKEQWLKLCSKMQLKAIDPLSLTRLSRPPDSQHKDKPRLLKVTLRAEKDLEDVLLSAFLLQNETENKERVFADVPWWERSRKPGKTDNINRAEDRSLIILGVPDTDETSDKKIQNKHDFLQWKFISDILKTDDVAVVDTFRIPRSPKYMGTGPKPLKLTLLRSEMLSIVKTQWQRYRNLLPSELRLSTTKRANKSTGPAEDATEQCGAPVKAKNGQPPTLSESVPL